MEPYSLQPPSFMHGARVPLFNLRLGFRDIRYFTGLSGILAFLSDIKMIVGLIPDYNVNTGQCRGSNYRSLDKHAEVLQNLTQIYWLKGFYVLSTS